MASVLVTGASSIVARWLVPLLQADGCDLVLVSRSRPAWLADEAAWVPADLRGAQWSRNLGAPIQTLIHLAPLPLLGHAVAALEPSGSGRIIAFGTTSRLTKVESTVAAEQRMVAEQAAAEDWLARYGASSGARWTLLRPTMIYDGQHDKNVALIARFIRRFGFFPLIGQAGGRRQPVHAADLAEACRSVLNNEATFGKTYNLAGAEVLTYKDMVGRIFAKCGRKPRYVRIPPSLLGAALNMARCLPRYRYLNAAMAGRMNKDLAFDSADAVRDFGYCPRNFL
ncbi:MAG TPA: NAD-dependent epimerase/dehydratase family protein [Gammaproteobacteria bacterium]|nr:NAD-dependent epimerase/dehydratase family protein [Gammaproteobacteria bacterium]